MSGLFGVAGGGLDRAMAGAIARAVGRLSTVAPDAACVVEAGYGDAAVGHACVIPGCSTAPCAVDGADVWLDGEVRVGEAGGDALHEMVAGIRGADASRLSCLDGLFTAVVVDGARRRVHLVGDRLGGKPLYVTQVGDVTCWASVPGAFVDVPGFSLRVAESGVRQLLAAGHVVGDGTLLEGVTRLPPGTVMTIDLAAGRTTRWRYWWWDRLPPVDERVSLDDAAEELGRLVVDSVRRACSASGRVGLLLSGGLDSRALLAAATRCGFRPPSVTFGQAGCLDERIARRVCEVAGVPHRFLPLTAANWLDQRAECVWSTGGTMNLTHFHVGAVRAALAGDFDVALDGVGGDNVLRGDWLQSPKMVGAFDRAAVSRWLFMPAEEVVDLEAYEALGRVDYFFLDHQARTLWAGANQAEMMWRHERRPFLSNAIIEFVYSLPDRLRWRGRLYRRMLLLYFPDYFRGIPWATTGVPISWPRGPARLRRYQWRLERRLFGGVTAWRTPGRGPRAYYDYDAWLRVEPGRTWARDVLMGDDAIYPHYAERSAAVSAWKALQQGAATSSTVCAYLTLEVWLQQALAGRWRPPETSRLPGELPPSYS